MKKECPMCLTTRLLQWWWFYAARDDEDLSELDNMMPELGAAMTLSRIRPDTLCDECRNGIVEGCESTGREVVAWIRKNAQAV